MGRLKRGQSMPALPVWEFWQGRAGGMSTAAAARHAGISVRLGHKLMAKHGGVIPTVSRPAACDEHGSGPQSRYLSADERDLIANKNAVGLSVRQIARDLARAPSTISRELRRNRPQHRTYAAGYAQRRAQHRRARPKLRKLESNDVLRAYVWDKLSGLEHWSPAQISARLVTEFADDVRMRISPEAIYRTLFVFPRGEMKQQVTASLRSGRSVRKPRTARTGSTIVPRELLIANRPAAVEDRAVPGDWEGDCILGREGHSQIGTLVERTTRFTILLHLPTTRTGQDLRTALAIGIGDLPAHLRRSITWDQGSEMRGVHTNIAVDHNLQVWFCDPHSPWQRGTNENTNGLLRQYFPKGTDLSVHSSDHLNQIATALNNRPRAALGFRTPAEAFTDLLASHHQP
ncbi:IS30 family transposase [Gordonia sp. SL306]|uniref:IS30 family transposase n=1 Tax=Gordonia sp. SL306 TaxID=2995145 RepID=UPI0022713AA7|nr:IS30 family transposase [Gordonia sp. SL306]WAC57065.1 IS30 family transposase [Gordonia sp. SL306]